MVQGAAGTRELPYDALLLGTGRKANVDSVGAISKHLARLCRPGRQASRAESRGSRLSRPDAGESRTLRWRAGLRFPVREVVISAFAKWNGSR